MIIDSNLTPAQAIRANPAKDKCPPHILKQQCLLAVHYYGFDGMLHRGQIVVHEDLTTDLHDFFELTQQLRFPIAKVVPLAHPDYEWDKDKTVLQDNLTYGFNYRTVHGTERLSDHALGRAIDVNPMQNPFIRQSNDQLRWPPIHYSPDTPGTFTSDSPLVKFLESRGWEWGGRGKISSEGAKQVDYMHFSKS